MTSKVRVLSEALCFVLITPVLLFALFVPAVKHFAPPTVQAKFGFLLFTFCGASQINALAKLRACSAWGFGWAKLGSWMLNLIAFVLLLDFGWLAMFMGYYLVHPDVPMLFGGN